MKLAIKKLEAVFWKTDLSVEDIQKMLQAGKITEEWLVCPQGEVGDAVLISDFLANPSIFQSIFKSNSHEKKDESKTKPKKNDLKKRRATTPHAVRNMKNTKDKQNICLKLIELGKIVGLIAGCNPQLLSL